MLIPSIDLFDGKAVQWRQGREPVLEREDVFQLLDEFSLYGEVAVIDLNAAMGRGDNRDLIQAMLRRHPCRVGGGIRDGESARFYLSAGASKIILGTACQEDFVRKIPREALVFAVDSRDDRVLSEGWRVATERTTTQAIEAWAQDCGEFLFTQVDREGMMDGLDRERVQRILAASPNPVTVAGGITTTEDVRFLHQLGANAQIGMALYTGRLNLSDAFTAMVDFEGRDLVPTVVQDAATGDVLMVAYSNRQSLARALRERQGVYFSRSRHQVWRKGETSGNVQELVRVDLDCDGDCLLFKVRQSGPACHLGRWSCFPGTRQEFDLGRLDRVLAQRQGERPAGSYSVRLFEDGDLRAAKLREEVEELIAANTPAEVRWEAADLLYFTLVAARAKGVDLAAIVAEMRSRHAAENR